MKECTFLVFSLTVLLLLAEGCRAGSEWNDEVLTIVSSTFTTYESGEVEQSFIVDAYNATTGNLVATTKLSQRRRDGRAFFTCTASDPNSHTLYYIQTDPETQAYALYNLTSTTPGLWQANTSFALSPPLPQPEISSVCQVTRFSGFPNDHGEAAYVWLNPTDGPILAIDAETGVSREVAITDKEGQSCCVQGVYLEGFLFYSVHASKLVTIDMENGRESNQGVPSPWYFLDVPLEDGEEGPILIVIERGGSSSNNYAPCLRRYNAENLQEGETLFQFDEKTAGLYGGLHQTLMTKSYYFAVLRTMAREDEAEYTVYVFETTEYQLITQFTITLADPSLYVYGLM